MNGSRRETIKEVLRDLESLKRDGDEKYAINANIKFFEALISPWSYIKWLLFEMPKLDGTRLLELSDFGSRRWQKILQQELLGIEKWRFPDILGPLRKEILRRIGSRSGGKNIIVAVNVGCGAMEIERQVILSLEKTGSKQPIIFFGIDESVSSLDTAEENLRGTNIRILRVDKLDPGITRRLIETAPKNLYTTVLFRGDALAADTYLGEGTADLVYHSKFKHHIPNKIKEEFDTALMRLGKSVIEADDYRGMYLLIFSSIMNWNKPILANGAIMSCLRVPTKKSLQEHSAAGWKTKVVPLGGYLRIYDNKTQIIDA